MLRSEVIYTGSHDASLSDNVSFLIILVIAPCLTRDEEYNIAKQNEQLHNKSYLQAASDCCHVVAS
jgi:hypothetical protein